MAIKKGFGSSSIDNIANGNKLDDFSLKSNNNTNKNTNNLPTDRGWLPAPYNIITEPVNAGGNTTNYGNNYAASKKAFDERVARIDQTEEAANLRQAWATPPRVSIDNGRIKLTGSTQFLASDTAQQLRNIFKEMEGQTYNTESLNQQIEAWNVDLQKMSEDNMKNLDALNEMNYSISQTATGPNPHMLTYADLLRIGNNVAVGRQEDALNSDKLIFVGYEWDDEGNQIPKYMTAKEFAEEFNSTPDPVGHSKNLAEAFENRSADPLISGKRRAWSQLNTQAAEGDPGAIAKLMYLQGGSKGGPANVVLSGTERFNDFVFTASINAMNGLTSGLDFATKWYNAAFGNVLGLPRLIGNISNVVGNGGDWSKFWESDVVDKQVEEMNDVVSWANSYFSAVTPGSTMLGAISGGLEGAIASIAYNVVSANIGQEMVAQAVNKGLTTAGNALELSGQGIRISATIEGAAGKLQDLTSMNGNLVTGIGNTIANATRGTAELSVVLPKFLVEKFPGIARAITEGAFSIQAASQGAQLAGMAGSDIGVFVTNTSPAFKSLFNNGAQSLALIAQGAKTVGNKFMLGKQALDSMRNWSTGIRLGLNLYMAGNYNTIRHIDRYLRDQYNGKDDGDMASYVAINTAKDVAIAAALGIGGATFNHFRQISKMSKIAPTRMVDAVQTGADNSANGFYTSSTSSKTTAKTKTEPAQEAHDEVTNIFNSSMTANGERFFVPNDATQATVVPGSSSVAGPQGVATATGVIRDNKLIRSRIVPAVGGFNVISSARDLATGEETTDITFHLDFDSANKELQKSTVPIVNPKTLGNSDLAVSANVAPLSVDGLSAIRHLPDGTSRLRISNDVLYLKPEEFEQKVSDIVAQMSPETAVEFTNSVRSIDLDDLAARVYGEGPELPAPQLRIPKNPEEAKAFARDVATARAVAQYNGDRGVVIPTRIDADTVDIVRRRRMVNERTFIGTTENDYQQTEYNPITLHTDISSGEENSWSGDAPNGAMSYAIGQDTDYVFAEDIMTSKNISDAYRSDGKIKDYNDIIALSAFSRMQPDDIYGVSITLSTALEREAGIEESLFRDYIQITRGAIDRNRKNFRTFAKGDTPFTKDDIHNFFERQRSFTQESKTLRNLDSYEKLMIRSYDRAIKWLRDNYSSSEVISPVDKMLNLAYSARVKYTDVLRKGVANDLKEKGKTIVTPIVVPAELSDNKTIAFFSPANIRLASNVADGVEGDNEYFIHLPKGTKVIQYAYYDAYGRRKYEWVADISNGYVDGGRNILNKEEGSYGPKELFAKTPDGKVYKPKSLEYDPSSYMIRSVDDRFSSSTYTQIGKDLLEPTGAVTGYNDGQFNMYELTKPSGIVNNVNGFLRKYGLMEDSMANRWDMLLKNAFHNGDVTEFSVTETTPGYITSTIKSLIHRDLNSIDNGFVFTEGSKLSEAVRLAKHAGKDATSFFMNELEDVLSTDIIQYLKDNDIRASGDGVMSWMIGKSDNWTTSLPKELIEKTLSDVSALVERYNSKLPSGYSGYLQQVIDYGTRGSHRVKGTPMIFTHRGLNEVGNRFNRANGDLPFANAKPGDHLVSNDFMFTSFNAMTPFGYANEANGTHQYVLTIGTPEGSEMYYYGDKDNDFNSRIHYNDGGAAVIPIGSGMTVVSRVELTPDITWLTIVRDGKDGTPYSGPIDKDVKTIEEVNVKRRKTIDIETRTPRKYVVTENGLTKGSFSDIQEALDYKAQGDRQIYELDPDTPVMDRPPVTTDSLYNPSVRSESAAGKMPEDTTYEVPKFDASGNIERFNGLMASMPLLRESPTDYTQGIVDIAREVQSVYNGLAKNINMPGLYEDYARQIAEGVEQPTVSPELRDALAPLSSMLDALGHYFDPSGSSLTQDFYLPTGAPSKKLASVEDALLHPDRAVDVDNPATVTFDEILVDPMRIGDSGFWEKRSGELFRDEDGNFTMAKAGTLEENLIAYTVAALTRGQNALLVAANDEVAFSKFDRNRNPISTTEALKGLKGADKNRQKIRAAQIKNARGYGKKLKGEKINKLEDNYDDKSVIDAIEESYAARDFAKDINYTRNVAENSRTLGYRRTLTINNIKGSALRFGSNNGFRGISNDIRKASYIKVTGTKWVTRGGEKRCVAFGLTDAQMAETEATVSEPAVNLGDSAIMLFNPDRAARAFYRTILDQSEQWANRGGWSLLNSIKDFARENFPLLSNPERAAETLFQQLTRNFDAYSDPTALYLANQETISTWIKKMAATHINSAIQMADVDAMDDRTIGAIDQIMTKALVGSSVYSSKIVSALQRATYASTLWFNPSPMIGNLLSEPARGIDFFHYKVFAKAMKQFINPKARAIAKTELGELDTYLNNDPELVGLAAQVKSKLARAFDSFENKAMSPLQKSEEQKNLLFWMMAKENAKLIYPKDPSAQLQNALRTFNDVAIAGGAGTTPGVASSNLGRMAFVLKTFSLRNWDDFIEMTKQIGYGRSGSYYWDRTNRGQDTGGQGGYSSTAGSKKFDYKKAGRFVGGTLLRRYLLWLFVLGPLGRSIWDALGGDPTGLTDNYSRGLYDDEGTDEYEGMTPLDNIINHIPTGFIFGTLKDFYFAARRAGVDTGNFLGPIDIERDARLQKDIKQHLPLGVMTRRVGDMLELMDRGYSFNSNGNKTYAAPQTLHDTIRGFALGKNATSNAQAYNKYRYGTVNIWGDIFEGDWLDFAMSANPLAGDLNMVKFDTTRTNYNGVFHGSYNDVPVMQAAVADLRERRATIIRGYNEDLEKFTGEFEGLTDEQKKAKAAERREAKIKTFTDDVQRLVDEYQKAGNALSDKQINTLMYLFDFNEGDDDTYDSQIARERYVQAELPDVSTNIVPKQDKDTGKVTEPNYFQRSLVYQNAVQGRYGIPREAAKAVDSALSNFKNVYKEYKNRVSELNDKAYSAAKSSADRKKYQAEVEKVQEEYMNQLYTALTPVVQQYGTEVLSSNDVIESLQPYMSSMVPYSSIKKYGLQYNNGNDIVWGQLSDWVKNRWGATAPTAGSDPEITNGIKEIKALKNQGKTAQAKSQARLLLERIARGSLSARNNDVLELRSLLYD